MSSLVLKNINKVYPNGVQAVFDFNLEIKDKEFIVFVGPSGCGKSTTLRMVAGLEDITSGEFFIDGELMNQVEPKDRNIAMVFQNYALYPHMTVYKNLKFGLKLRKVDKPIFTNLKEVKPLDRNINKLKRKIRKINKRFKKNQNDFSELPTRSGYYNEIFELEKQKGEILIQAKGIDELGIKRCEKEIKKHEKSIEKNNKLIAKFAEKFPKETESLRETNEKSQKEIKKAKARIQYLEKNEVELYSYRHLTKYEMDLEINQTAEAIDLTKYLFRKPSALSGGQRQRVALGRAIVRKPKVFLMDEPLSNLDAKLRVQTRSEISKIHKNVGATTIYVTHDQVEAMTMADRIVVMKDGWIQQIGTPKQLFNNPANKFVASFIGAPGMNFIEGTLNGDKFVMKEKNKQLVYKLSPKILKKLKDYNNKKVILGIRPEDIHIAKGKESKFGVSVTYSELLGYDLMLYFSIGNSKVVAKVDEQQGIKEGTKINVNFDESKLHFFDIETERSIY